MPFEVYRALDGANYSTLKHILTSPKHYRSASRRSDAPTATMILGSATHAAILEPKRFALDVAVWEGGTRRGKVYDAWCEANAGKVLTRHQDMEHIFAMAKAVHQYEPAMEYLDDEFSSEVVIQWEDPGTGVLCKGRLDGVVMRRPHPDQPAVRATIVDLKTARSIDGRQFGSAAAKYGYHMQLAHYRNGLAVVLGIPVTDIDVVIIAVENTPPYDVGVFRLDEAALAPGEDAISEAIETLARCRETGDWPGRYETEQVLELPRWIYPEEDDSADGLGLIFGGEE